MPLYTYPVPEGRPKPSGGSAAYTIPGVDTYTAGTNAPSVNQLRYMPIFVTTTITVDQIACEVTGFGVSGNVRMGIYTADVNWQPVTLLVDSGTVSAGSNGIKTASINLTLAPGRYLMVFNSDVSATFRNYLGGMRYGQLIATLGANGVNDLFFINSTFGALNTTPVLWTGTNGATTGLRYYCFLRIATP
jgi:hypothetical protein